MTPYLTACSDNSMALKLLITKFMKSSTVVFNSSLNKLNLVKKILKDWKHHVTEEVN